MLSYRYVVTGVLPTGLEEDDTTPLREVSILMRKGALRSGSCRIGCKNKVPSPEC